MADVIMANRIAQVIEYTTGGSRQAFADATGWSKQFVNKLLNGDSIGVNTLRTIAERFPEISARWLLTGQGAMIDTAPIIRTLKTWLELEDFIPYMTADERRQIQDGRSVFDADTLARWSELKAQREASINARFAAAYDMQN